MNHYKTQPPWEFLLSASRNSLQSYELSRLNHAANLRKEVGTLPRERWGGRVTGAGAHDAGHRNSLPMTADTLVDSLEKL